MSMNLQNPPDILMGVVQSTTYPNGDTLPYAPANLVPVSTGTQWTTTPIGSHAPLTSISAAYSASNANHTILATLTAGFTVTLPAAAIDGGRPGAGHQEHRGAFTLTIAPSGSDHIEGSGVEQHLHHGGKLLRPAHQRRRVQLVDHGPRRG